MNICKHFIIQELVPPDIYETFGEGAWIYVDQAMIKALDRTRDFFVKKYGPSATMVINNWHKGGPFSNRGYRSALSKVGSPKSQHRLTPLNAIDFNIRGVSDLQVKADIIDNNEYFFNLGWRRMESYLDSPTWTHLDRKPTNLKIIKTFRA